MTVPAAFRMRLNPFAFLREVRDFFDGPVVLAGGIANGQAIRAAQILGADGVYMGTRFLAASESLASEDYKAALATSGADDIVLTTAVSGLPGNFLRQSLERYGLHRTGGAGELFNTNRGNRGQALARHLECRACSRRNTHYRAGRGHRAGTGRGIPAMHLA